MSEYEDSCILENLSHDDMVRICMEMHPEMTKEQILEKLTNGEGIEIKMDYIVKKLRAIIQNSINRN